MPDASSRAHALGKPGINDSAVADRILMLKLPFQNPGHNFHILMGMCHKSRIWLDDIVIADQKKSMMGIFGIMMISKAEAVVRIQPIYLRLKTLITSLDSNSWISCHSFDLLMLLVI